MSSGFSTSGEITLKEWSIFERLSPRPGPALSAPFQDRALIRNTASGYSTHSFPPSEQSRTRANRFPPRIRIIPSPSHLSPTKPSYLNPRPLPLPFSFYLAGIIWNSNGGVRILTIATDRKHFLWIWLWKLYAVSNDRMERIYELDFNFVQERTIQKISIVLLSSKVSSIRVFTSGKTA